MLKQCYGANHHHMPFQTCATPHQLLLRLYALSLLLISVTTCLWDRQGITSATWRQVAFCVLGPTDIPLSMLHM